MQTWENQLCLTWKSMSYWFPWATCYEQNLCRALIKKFMYMQQFFQIYWDKGLTVPIQYSTLLCVMPIDFKQAKYLLVLFFKWKMNVHIAINHRSLKSSVWWLIPWIYGKKMEIKPASLSQQSQWAHDSSTGLLSWNSTIPCFMFSYCLYGWVIKTIISEKKCTR